MMQIELHAVQSSGCTDHILKANKLQMRLEQHVMICGDYNARVLLLCRDRDGEGGGEWGGGGGGRIPATNSAAQRAMRIN